MLFDANIEPMCSYCCHSTALGRGEFACIKQGIMYGSGYCRLFLYDPMKRVPPVMPTIDSSAYSEDDFAL